MSIMRSAFADIACSCACLCLCVSVCRYLCVCAFLLSRFDFTFRSLFLMLLQTCNMNSLSSFNVEVFYMSNFSLNCCSQ
jgi:hypothetical protein